MRVKLDENLPLRLAPRLVALGHDVVTVRDEGLVGADDTRIWEAAQLEGRFLVTQDLGFSEIAHFAPSGHAGVLLVRLQEPARPDLLRRVEAIFREENAESWDGCIVAATERKLRVRRPKQ